MDEEDLEDFSGYVCQRLRVYIGCSLTSRDESGLRERLLSEAERLFSANGFEVYSPCKFTKPGSPHSSQEVYAIDHINAMRADLHFFIRRQPSLGMGIEAQIGSDLLIPRVDAWSTDKAFHMTPLLAGLPGSRAIVRLYFDASDLEDFSNKLQSQLESGEIRRHVLEIRQDVDRARDAIRALGLGRLIRRQRLILNMSAEELGGLVDIAPWWIESIERDCNLVTGHSLIQLIRLVDATQLRFVVDPERTGRFDFPKLVPARPVDPALVNAADQFANYSLRMRRPGEPPQDADSVMLDQWRDWVYGTKDIRLPARKIDNEQDSISKLSVCMAIPHSNLDEQGQQQRDQIVREVQETLSRFPGVEFDLKIPDFLNSNREDHASAIYLRGLRRVCEADLGIILATPAATGVGITAQLFANATIPCICIADKSSTVSRMFRGVYFPRIDETIEYGPSCSIAGKLEQILTAHMSRIRRSTSRRRAARSKIIEIDVMTAIDRHRIPTNTSRDEAIGEFGRRPNNIREEWLTELANTPGILPFVTLLQFVYIAQQMNWSMSVASTGVPCLLPPLSTSEIEPRLTEKQHRAAEQSLDNLVFAIRETRRRSLFGVDERTVFHEWEKYLDELTPDAADYPMAHLVRTTQQWLDVLLQSGQL